MQALPTAHHTDGVLEMGPFIIFNDLPFIVCFNMVAVSFFYIVEIVSRYITC
jgi:hypothetical protein